ncbi:Mitochondrial outer membrane protein iml2 [Coniothyrium glycines]
MFKVGGWLKGHAPVHTTKSFNALEELAQIEDAMSAVTYIMDDDLVTAEEHLNKGSTPFHQLGVGVCTFMRATLGFEQDIMKQAGHALYQAENSAYEHQIRAKKGNHSHQSAIYPPGTEYAVCQAEAQLMSAVVGMLNESFTEAIKSFYKLRKAYLALEAVMEYEKKFLKEKSTSSVNSAGLEGPFTAASVRSNTAEASRPVLSTRPSAAPSVQSLSQSQQLQKSISQKEAGKKASGSNSDDEDFDFVDAKEDRSGGHTPLEYAGHTNAPAGQVGSLELDNADKKLNMQPMSASKLPAATENASDSVPEIVEDFQKPTTNNSGDLEVDMSLFSDNPVDRFILAGSNFCFGMLLLILSFTPPAFAGLLKIVGFKGDRERGMQMLWQATKFDDIHGAMSGVVLMGYLNGFSSFCDIVPSIGPGSFPRERCMALLQQMRARYPKSHLWLIEEARMLASAKELEKANEFVSKAGESPLRQLEALGWFERSLNSMYMHDYEGTSVAFQKCIELNNWSHGLYWYICASAQVEQYRRHKTTDPAAAKVYADKAEEFFKNVPPNLGKKKFMARQLPFDVYVGRKLQKWEARATEFGCPLIDAIGVSPMEEMIYFWNGHKRMREDHLQTALENLVWSESSANPYWEKEDIDEKSILALLRAVVLRNLNKTGEAKELLATEILPHDKLLFKGPLKDDWTAPCARYEMAANLWCEAEVDGHPEQHPQVLEQIKNRLDEVTNWGSFNLDARIGMKIASGKETLRKLGVQV